MVILLYASRACYNLVVLALTNIESINSFDYDWYNVSDQVGVTHSSRLISWVAGAKSGINTFFLWFCRRICAPVWATRVTWCSVWFCSCGSCCPHLWWFSSSGCENRPRTGWAGADLMSVYSIERIRSSAHLTDLCVFCCFLERLCHSQPRLLKPTVFLRQSQTIRQRRRFSLGFPSGDHLNQVKPPLLLLLTKIK